MAFINDIVVSITTAITSTKKKSFRPLIIGSGSAEKEVIIASSLADVTAAGYSNTDEEYKMASAMFSQEKTPKDIAIFTKLDTTDYDDALTSLIETFNDFWSVCIQSRTQSDLNAVGDWCNANKKFFFGCNIDPLITARNVDREVYMIHNEASKYPECAWVGGNISKTIGSFIWKWQKLSGHNAANFSLTQLIAIRNKNMQTLQTQSGVTYTNGNFCTSGRRIDDIMEQDWVKSELENGILLLHINNEKVSIDGVGLAKTESVVRNVLTKAAKNGIICVAESEEDMEQSDDKKYMFTVAVPTRSDLDPADIANREIKGIGFKYYKAVGSEKVEVNGVITV